MNRIYRIVFNACLGIFQVVSEHTRSRGKTHVCKHGTAVAAVFLLGSAGAFGAELPTGGVVVHGSATISTSGATSMRIDQATDTLITNWQSFDIGAGHSVVFDQPSSSSIALNRVLGSDGSKIMGSLTANGKVFLVNPNGILFGQGAQVSAGGLVASTLDIADGDFLAGNYRFTGRGQGAGVSNKGNITVADGGFVALLGGRVSNEGVIVARLGSVALAAGEAVTLDFGGDGLISVQIDQATRDALVENHQLIQADGGTVILTASAAEALVQDVVNNQGVIRARSLENREGEIVLDGGSGYVTVAGTLDAGSDAGAGGHIQVTGDAIAVTNARLDASGATGGGSIEIGGGYQGTGGLAHASSLGIDSGTVLTADALDHGDGGTIVAWSDGQTTAQGRFSARGGVRGGDGGLVETSGHSVTLSGIAVDTRAPAGDAGTWLIDPEQFTIGSGGDISGADVASALASNGEFIAVATDGDVMVNDAIAWSSGTLTLSASKSVKINNVLTATGTAGLVANYGSGTDADGVPYGLYTSLNGSYLSSNAPASAFAGRIDFTGTGALSLGGEQYTVITDGSQFAQLNGSSGKYALGADISFNNNNVSTFSGKLNGLGHKILFQNAPSLGGSGIADGLFDTLTATAQVSNLSVAGKIEGDANGNAFGGLADINYGKIINVVHNQSLYQVTNTSAIGGLVGVNHGLIADSHRLYDVTATAIAGTFVGINDSDGRIVRSSVNTAGGSGGGIQATADTVTYVGAFAGVNRGRIEKSYSELYLKISGSALNTAIGGNFVGLNEDGGVIDQSFVVKGTSSTSAYGTGQKIGGFVGENRGIISNAYFYNPYSNIEWAGGFAYINAGEISNSYAQDTSIKNPVQRYGFVAIDQGGTVTNSYYKHGYYAGNVPPVMENSTAAESDLIFADTASLAAAGFDTGIWGLSGSGHPILSNIPVYLAAPSVTYGSDVLASIIGVGLQHGDTVSNTFSLSTAGRLDVGTYDIGSILSLSPRYANIFSGGPLTITPKAITIRYVINDKVYDGTNTATFKSEEELDALEGRGLYGLVDGETLNINYLTAFFGPTAAGNNRTVYLTYELSDGTGKVSNYTVATSTFANITKRTLAASDLLALAADKTYDGTTAATVSLSSNDAVALADIGKGALSFAYADAAFADPDAGADKTVTVSGLTLNGTAKNNYTLAAGVTLQDQADIDPRVVQLSGSKLNDGSNSVTADRLYLQNKVGSDDVTLGGSVVLAGSTNGTHAITDLSGLGLGGSAAGNYTLEGAGGNVAINTIDSGSLVLEQLVSGAASADSAGKTITITQIGDKAILNWLKFSLAQDETLVFQQPSSSAVVLNRVTGSDPSVIAGALRANGRVFILNPNGVLFTSSSQVDVSALVASTLSLNDSDFLDDERYVFVAGPSETGSVVAEGDIVIVDGGLLALASGKGVTLAGSVDGVAGTGTTADVVVASAEGLQLDMAGSALVDHAVSGLSGSAVVSGHVRQTGASLLETAGDSVVTDGAILSPGTRSITLPTITLGAGGTYGGTFIEEQLAARNLELHALEGGLTVSGDVTWSADTRLELAARDGIRIEGRIAASGESAGLTLDGGYYIDSARLDYEHQPVGYQNAGITLNGENATLTVDGLDYALLHDMADVVAVNGDVSGRYALAQEIDAAGTTYGAAPITNFSGTLAGLGNAIRNLAIDAGETDYVGLIGQAQSGAVIRDLGLEAVSVKGRSYLGALLGSARGVDLDNVWASGTVTAETQTNEVYSVGGLAGVVVGDTLASRSTVTRARADVNVEARGPFDVAGGGPETNNEAHLYVHRVGGLFGQLISSDLSHSYAEGDVLGGHDTGGLIGVVTDGSVSYSWASGDVTAMRVTLPDGRSGIVSDNLGGLVGSTTGSAFDHVDASGTVTGGDRFGGLIGYAVASTIDYATASGNVISDFIQTGHFISNGVGGLIGYMSGGSVSNSSASGDVDGGTYDDAWEDRSSGVGGLIGELSGGNVSSSIATGNVRGRSSIGELIGRSDGGTVSDDSYGSGAVATTPGDAAPNPDTPPSEEGGGEGSEGGGDADGENAGGSDTNPGGTPDGGAPIVDGPSEPPRLAGVNAAAQAAMQNAIQATATVDHAAGSQPLDPSGNSGQLMALLNALNRSGQSGAGGTVAHSASFSSQIDAVELDGVTFQLGDPGCEGENCPVSEQAPPIQ